MENEIEVSLERGNFSTFTKKNVAYRPSLIPGRLTDLKDLELPDDSTLHTINHFLELAHPLKDAVAPDFEFPLVKNERWQVYFKSFLQFANDKTQPIPMTEKFSFNGVRYQPLINKLYSTNRHVHRMMAESALANQKNILMWFDYTALMQARISGTMAEYRKFDAIFRTMLDHVADSIGNRHHYFVFPLSPTPYSQAFIKPAFSALSMSTVKAHNDPSFFVLIHLLGYLNAFLHPVKAKPFSLDVSYWKKNKIEPPELTSTSLLARFPQDKIPQLNMVFYIGEKCIIYNLGDLKEMAQETQNIFQRILKHVNILKLSAGDELEESRLLSLRDEDVEKEVVAKSPSPEITNKVTPAGVGPDTTDQDTSDGDLQSTIVTPQTPIKDKTTPTGSVTQTVPHPKPELKSFSPIKPVTVKVKQREIEDISKKESPHKTTSGPATSPILAHIHEGLKEKLAKTEAKDPAKLEDKARTLLDKHMAVELGGKPLGYYASATTSPEISESKLEYLKDQVPEKSQMNSSVMAFDQTYLKNVHFKDLANTLTVFAKHGLFVSKIDETHTNTHLDKLTTYKVSFSDLNGKTHTVPFTFATVDKNGYQMVNGVKTRMILQVVNIPICKISPTRVNLASNYNKTLVERVTSTRHQYNSWISGYLFFLRDNKLITFEFGKFVPTEQLLPYEYTSISRTFSKIVFDKFTFTFDYPNRFNSLPKSVPQDDALLIEESYGVFCGVTKDNDLLMWDMDDNIHVVDGHGKHITSYESFITLLDLVFGDAGYPPPPMVSEWVTLKILDITLPLVYILGFKFGLKQILSDLDAQYRVVEKGEKFTVGVNEVAIPFQDATLIINRYPFQAFLIISGLLRFKTKSYPLLAFESEDIYYRIFQDNGIKINYLRGIDDFFSFFLDPITIDVLARENEPVTVKGLLYRATQMLSTMDYLEASASAHHRFRGYERQSSVLYNEVSRQLAQYNNRQGQKKSFSINPDSVFQRLQQDPTDLLIDTINPIHELKEVSHVSYSGSGGRTGRAFVVNDRRFASDSVGILSEATPDSGKVAITSYTSVDPRIKDIRGRLTPFKKDDKLETPQLLSVTGNLFPATSQDDGKRANYTAIQVTHHVGNKNQEVLPIRTGFERTIAPRTTEVFASTAADDGTVIDVNEKAGMLKVQYADKPVVTSGELKLPYPASVIDAARNKEKPFGLIIPASMINAFQIGQIFSATDKTNVKVLERIRFRSLSDVPDKVAVKHVPPALVKALKDGDEDTVYYIRLLPTPVMEKGDVDIIQFGITHTSVSGSYMKQTVVPNIKKGESFKKGDVLAYNEGFFVPDKYTKQVDWSHGILATVALIEMSATLEDGCMVSRAFSQKAQMEPAHLRTITIENDTVIHSIVDIGTHVETTDFLCTVEAGDLEAASMSDDPEMVAHLAQLDRKAPRAKYPGVVEDIVVYYSCPKEKLHPSILNVVKSVERRYNQKAEFAKNTVIDGTIATPGFVQPGSKYHGVEFTDNTVVLEFMIAESIPTEAGDKLVVCSANKTIVTAVVDKQITTQTGKPVDIVFSSVSIMARIVCSPYIVGIATPNQKAIREGACEIFFGKD